MNMILKIVTVTIFITGVGWTQAPVMATQAECEAAVITGKAVSPLCAKQLLDANGTSGVVTSLTVEGFDCAGTSTVGCTENGTVVVTKGGNNDLSGITSYTPSTAQVIDAVTDIPLCNATNVQLDPDASYTLDPSSTNPIIADGTNGQLCVITNVDSTYSITFTDQDTMSGSNVQLAATTVALLPKRSLTLRFNSAVGDWVQDVSGASSSTNAVTSLCYWAPVTGITTTSSINQVTPCSISSGTLVPGSDTIMCRMGIYRDVVSSADTAQLSISFVYSNASGTTIAVSSSTDTGASATVTASASTTLTGMAELSIIPLANAIQVLSITARQAGASSMSINGTPGGSIGTLDTSANAFTIEPRVWSTSGLTDDTFRFGAFCTLTRTN